MNWQKKVKMKFSTDWFTNNILNFEECMKSIEGTHDKFLEIGVFEGRSTCWLLKHGLNDDGTIFCIDSFYGVDGYVNNKLKQTFEDNILEIKKPTQKVNLYSSTSYNGLAEIIYEKYGEFKFIYIDGAHDARTTLSDACMAWGILDKGGVMLFDDYEWQHGETEQEKPKLAVDCFLETFKGKYEILFKNYQLGVKKL
jgi:predicted O-methyltransferase YrrM